MTPRRLALLLVVAGAASCAPSREEMLSPVQDLVRTRLGQHVDWRGETKDDAAVDAAVKNLLAGELSEVAAVQVALLRNRELVAAYEGLGVSQSALVQAGLLENPVFSFGLGFSSERTSPDFDVGVEEDFLSLIFLPMRTQAASANVEATRARTTAKVVDVAAQARRAWVDVVAAQQLLELHSTVVEAAEAAWDLARRQHDGGNITDLEWLTEQARYKEAVLALSDAEREARLARERLNAALGLFGMETAWRVPSRLDEGALDAPAEKTKREHLENKAVGASLMLSSMRSEMDGLASSLGYESARRFIPTFDLGAGVERDDASIEIGPRASIALPILDMGQGQVLAAESRLRMRGEEYAALAVNVRAKAREAIVNAENASERERFIKNELLPVRAGVVEEAQKHYNAMLIGAFVLLDARKSQVEAGVEYVRALRASNRARVDIDALLAGGSALPSDGGAMESMMQANNDDDGAHR